MKGRPEPVSVEGLGRAAPVSGRRRQEEPRELALGSWSLNTEALTPAHSHLNAARGATADKMTTWVFGIALFSVCWSRGG
jgi:hypothetical protein